MLTWGAFEIVGGKKNSRNTLLQEQQALVRSVTDEIDRLKVETDGKGWRTKVFLYCVEVRCPQTGWMVPLLPSFVVSTSRRVVAELVPDASHKRYDITISTVSEKDFARAKNGTVRTDGRGQENGACSLRR